MIKEESCVKFHTSSVYKSSNLLFPLPSKLLKSLIQPIVLIPRKILKDVQTAARWDVYSNHLDVPLSTRIQCREKINIFGNILQTLWHSRMGSFVRKFDVTTRILLIYSIIACSYSDKVNTSHLPHMIDMSWNESVSNFIKNIITNLSHQILLNYLNRWWSRRRSWSWLARASQPGNRKELLISLEMQRK